MVMRLNRWNQLIRGRQVIDGVWRLTPRHELQYQQTGNRNEVMVSGPITQAGALGLSFRVAETSVDEDVVDREMTLRGIWQADDRNRLKFLAERQDGSRGRLTLQGAWEIGPRQEILYRWQAEAADGGRRSVSRLIRFLGYWDVGEDKRLVYHLEESSDSGFRFMGAFQTPSVLPKRGELRYQLGVEAEGRRLDWTITLFGKWKVSDRWGLSFEMPYREGRPHSIDFGVSYHLDRLGNIACQLRTRQGKSLGLELTLTREFQKGQGEAFLRLRRSIEESAVEGGVRFQW